MLVHWYGMCEYLYRHLMGGGAERFLRLGYIPEIERPFIGPATPDFMVGTTLVKTRILNALLNQNYEALRMIYLGAKTQPWGREVNRLLIKDVEGFGQGKYLHYRSLNSLANDHLELRQAAERFFDDPDSHGLRMCLVDELHGVEVDKETIDWATNHMTKGSVLLHALKWRNRTDAIYDCGIPRYLSKRRIPDSDDE